jgi:hypothetical protein
MVFQRQQTLRHRHFAHVTPINKAGREVDAMTIRNVLARTEQMPLNTES